MTITQKKLLFGKALKSMNPFYVVPKKMGVYRVGGKGGALSHQRLEKGMGGGGVRT